MVGGASGRGRRSSPARPRGKSWIDKRSRRMKRKKPWGGRFEGDTHPKVEAFTASIHFDRRLAPHDIAGSIAHAQMLAKCGLLSKKEMEAIVAGLTEIQAEIERGGGRTDPALEDIPHDT